MSGPLKARTLTTTCNACGRVDTVTAPVPPEQLLAWVNEAHDVGNPDCPNRYMITDRVQETTS